MSDILIRGMELPKEQPLIIKISQDGTVYMSQGIYGIGHGVATAVPIPPHGDLIDRDALMKGEGRYIISFGKEGIDVAEINRAPTIIPASE